MKKVHVSEQKIIMNDAFMCNIQLAVTNDLLAY